MIMVQTFAHSVPGPLVPPGTSNVTADTVATQYLDVGTSSLGYRVLGSAMKAPLLLLQRFRGSMDDWDSALLDALAKKRPVIVFDSAGVGRSTGQVPDSIEGMANVAAAFIRALGYTEVDLLGYSLGGQVALALALEYPTLVRRVVVAASSPGGVPNAPTASAAVWDAAMRDTMDMEDFLHVFFPLTPDGRGQGYEHYARLYNRAEAMASVTPQAFGVQYAAIMAMNASDAIYARLPMLMHPTLLASGVHDLMFPAYHAFAAVERLPRGQLVVYPNSAHAFLFQLYDRFASTVHEFLDRVEHAPAALVPAPPPDA
jgi:pimeloyl-ACP methyl ester carboxylesterase